MALIALAASENSSSRLRSQSLKLLSEISVMRVSPAGSGGRRRLPCCRCRRRRLRAGRRPVICGAGLHVGGLDADEAGGEGESATPRSSTSRSPLGRKAQSVGLVPSPETIAQRAAIVACRAARPSAGRRRSMTPSVSSRVEPAMGEAGGAMQTASSDSLVRVAASHSGMVTSRAGAGRDAVRRAAKSATRVRFSKPTRTAAGCRRAR